MWTYHCSECGIERSFEELVVRERGPQITKCPKCGSWMKKGPLPLPAPDPKELSGLRKALAAVKEAIARQRPEGIEALRAEIAQTRAEIARLREQAAPEPDVEALLKDALAEAQRLEHELQERKSNLEALRRQEAALTARLASLEKAEREAKARELEARLHQPWPGEKELTDALCKWRIKFEGAFEEAVHEWRREANSMGFSGYPPGLSELLRRCWENAGKTKRKRLEAG